MKKSIPKILLLIFLLTAGISAVTNRISEETGRPADVLLSAEDADSEEMAAEITVETNTETRIETTPEAETEQMPLLPSEMKVHFIDVGQGDATLIQSGDAAMLIDAGDDTKGTLLQNYLQKQGVTKLDYLILTHPDADHIGGAPVIVTKFEVDRVFMSNFEKDNKTYRKLIQALDDKRLSFETPAAGSRYRLGDAEVTILAPVKEYENPNNASIALIVYNGENSFLFTGDAKEEAENDLLTQNTSVRADVYQAGHHGSRTSSSIAFMQAVNPAYAVISCKEGNSYGHPHAQTMNRFRERGMKVFRTDEQGSIIAVSDGSEITWNCAPSESWQAGEPVGSAAIKEQAEKQQSNTPENGNTTAATIEQKTDNTELTYVLNVRTMKFHRPDCGSLPTTNRSDSSQGREEIMAQGYEPCKRCNP